MKFLPGGLLAIALLVTGCTSSSTPAPVAAYPGQVVTEAQASAARAQAGKPHIVISGAVGAELANAYNPDTPPAPRAQIIPPKPSAKAVWHPGFWFWATYRWLWIYGFWK